MSVLCLHLKLFLMMYMTKTYKLLEQLGDYSVPTHLLMIGPRGASVMFITECRGRERAQKISLLQTIC